MSQTLSYMVLDLAFLGYTQLLETKKQYYLLHGQQYRRYFKVYMDTILESLSVVYICTLHNAHLASALFHSHCISGAVPKTDALENFCLYLVFWKAL